MRMRKIQPTSRLAPATPNEFHTEASRERRRASSKEARMSDGHEKRVSLLDKGRMEAGIYKLGFDPESARGFMLPFIVTVLIGGFLGALIYFWL